MAFGGTGVIDGGTTNETCVIPCRNIIEATLVWPDSCGPVAGVTVGVIAGDGSAYTFHDRVGVSSSDCGTAEGDRSSRVIHVPCVGYGGHLEVTLGAFHRLTDAGGTFEMFLVHTATKGNASSPTGVDISSTGSNLSRGNG